MKKKVASILAAGVLTTGGVIPTDVEAGLLTKFDSSWTQFQLGGANEDDTLTEGAAVLQAFDAEYLLYKMTGSILSIGLQAGFDLVKGQYVYDNKTYYAGDLALSFDKTPNLYEYAVDFGLLTKDYNDDNVDADATGTSDGKDIAGFYQNVTWGGYMYFHSESPFAMTDGQMVDGVLLRNDFGPQDSESEFYYRIVELDLSKLGMNLSQGFTLSAHWTMSCGNDIIEGSTQVAPVPEPATIFLFGTGIAGLVGVARRRKKQLES